MSFTVKRRWSVGTFPIGSGGGIGSPLPFPLAASLTDFVAILRVRDLIARRPTKDFTATWKIK